jgi:hypothetical protein
LRKACTSTKRPKRGSPSWCAQKAAGKKSSKCITLLGGGVKEDSNGQVLGGLGFNTRTTQLIPAGMHATIKGKTNCNENPSELLNRPNGLFPTW